MVSSTEKPWTVCAKNKKARTLDFVEDLTEGDETQAVNGLEQLELQERNAMIQEALEQLPESDAAIVSFIITKTNPWRKLPKLQDSRKTI